MMFKDEDKMTNKHTLSIDQTEWRVLFASNIARVNEFINATTSLTPENLKQLHEHLERAKLLASAWQKSQPAATAQEPIAQPMAVNTNGATPVRKRRGRPSNAEIAARAVQ